MATHSNYPTSVSGEFETVYDNLPYHQRSVIIPHNLILTLPTIPIIVIPSQGDNKIIVPLNGILWLETTTPYNNINNSATLGFQWETGRPALSQLEDQVDNSVSTLLESDVNIGALFLSPQLVGSPGSQTTAFVPFLDGVIDSQILFVGDNGNSGDFEEGIETNKMKISFGFLIFDVQFNKFI